MSAYHIESLANGKFAVQLLGITGDVVVEFGSYDSFALAHAAADRDSLERSDERAVIVNDSDEPRAPAKWRVGQLVYSPFHRANVIVLNVHWDAQARGVGAWRVSTAGFYGFEWDYQRPNPEAPLHYYEKLDSAWDRVDDEYNFTKGFMMVGGGYVPASHFALPAARVALHDFGQQAGKDWIDVLEQGRAQEFNERFLQEVQA